MGLLDSKFNSSPRPRVSWSAQPQSLPGVPNPRVSLECPTPEFPRSTQPQSLPTAPNSKVSLECPVPNRRLSLECPTPESQPQSLPGVPKPRVSPGVPNPERPQSVQPQSVPGVPNPRVSLPREWGCSKSNNLYASWKNGRVPGRSTTLITARGDSSPKFGSRLCYSQEKPASTNTRGEDGKGQRGQVSGRG